MVKECDDVLGRLRAALRERYRVEREIGRGGMASVYLARDLRHDRDVAIKVVAPELAHAVGSARFLREIQVAAPLVHPHIIGLIDSGEADGLLYYIMPYVGGETLRDRLTREKRLPIAEAARIASEVASALEYAHQYGIVHRDIKPENILLVDGQHAAVADFGLARAVFTTDTADNLTRSGLIVGSPYYISPEQASAEREVDGRSDIYSLGCVLFEMLSGKPPFQGETAQTVLTRHLTAQPPRLRSYRADAPASLDNVVQRALTKRVDARYQSAREFRADLLEAAGGTGRRRALLAGLRPRRRAIVAGGAALAVLLLAIRFSDNIIDRTSGLLGAPLDGDRYVVLPFHRGPGVPDDVHAEHVLNDALSRWGGIDVIDQFQTEAHLPRDSDERTTRFPHRVARRLHAGRYITGNIRKVGDSLRVHAEVRDTRTRNALENGTATLSLAGAAASAQLMRLADRLLFSGKVPTNRVEAPPGTTVYPAQRAYLDGLEALDAFDLATAESAFAKAITHDRAFAAAYLWRAQVRSWLSDNSLEWRPHVEQALAQQQKLPERDRRVARALLALARKDFPAACSLYRQLKLENPTDFVATYGIGECNRRDSVVVRDPTSSSGWSYRSSPHTASLAYQEAFQLIPGLHKVFHAQAFRRVREFFYTETNRRLYGVHGDTLRFLAAPSWQGDTLAFVPYPMEQTRNSNRINPAATVEAVNRQRSRFWEVASAWRTSYPRSSESAEAMAIALELLYHPAAVDTLRLAQRLAETETHRVRLVAHEVWMLVKAGVPNDIDLLQRARVLADSVLSLRVIYDLKGSDGDLLASLAVLTGRPLLAATISRRAASSSARGGDRLASNAAALTAFAAAGGPRDSMRALEQRILTDINTTTAEEDRARRRLELLGRAAALAYPVYVFSSLEQLRGRNDIINAQIAHNRKKPAEAKRILTELALQRSTRRPSDFTLDIAYPGAALLWVMQDTLGAREWIVPVLDAAANFPPRHLSHPANAGGFMRGMMLRAEIARVAGDSALAGRWNQAVDVLWKNADPGLRTLIEASHRLKR